MRSLVPVLIVACSLTAAAQVTRQERAGIVNFSKVDAVIACGGATETSALDGLARDGFKSVINLRMASEANANIELNAAHARSLGLTYIHIPFNAAQPEHEVIDKFLAAVSNKANQPAYVHCGSANRVGAVWLAKRVVQDGWTVEKATEEAKAIGLRSDVLEKFALSYIAAHKK